MIEQGLEQQIRAQGWQPQPSVGTFVDLIGPLWHRGQGIHTEYGLQVTEKHLNSNGIVHGGLLMTLIDQVISHVIWNEGDQTPMATIDMGTHFISPARVGDWLSATAQVQRRTRSLVFTTGQLQVDNRIVLAVQAIMKLRT